MKVSIELGESEQSLVEALALEEVISDIVIQEMQKAVERVQHFLQLRKNYAISGAMRWENSQEAWMRTRASTLHIGELR